MRALVLAVNRCSEVLLGSKYEAFPSEGEGHTYRVMVPELVETPIPMLREQVRYPLAEQSFQWRSCPRRRTVGRDYRTIPSPRR